jgi:hypothetical protein
VGDDDVRQTHQLQQLAQLAARLAQLERPSSPPGRDLEPGEGVDQRKVGTQAVERQDDHLDVAGDDNHQRPGPIASAGHQASLLF